MCAEQQGRFNVTTWKTKKWRDEMPGYNRQMDIKTRKSNTGTKDLRNGLTGLNIKEFNLFLIN